MVHYLVIASALLGVTPIKISDLEGRLIPGQLVGIDRGGVEYGTQDGKGRVEMDVLLTVTFENAERRADRATGSLELLDGTVLAITDYGPQGGTAHDYRAQGDTAHITMTGGVEVDVPTRLIHWVRFRAPEERNAKLAKQWADVLASKPSADMLVVRKKGSLDYLEGVLGEVNDKETKFTADKDALAVPRARVEGLVYFHAKPEEPPAAVCQAIDAYGSGILARDISFKDGNLEMTTPGGLTLAIPVERFSRLDYSVGKIAYLSDLEPESTRYTPFFGLTKELPAVSEFYALRRDAGFDQAPLQLDGKKYAKGIALASRTSAVYRLPGKFNLFRAVVGIDDGVRDGGNVRVEIKGDGKSLWEATVTGIEKAKPLALDVAGVRRLEIFVDFGDDLDVADRLDLCDARVTK